MSARPGPKESAERFLAIYAGEALQYGARLWTYTEVAVALGWAPSLARNMMAFLNALRDRCQARGLPDLRAVIVAAGTDLPSRKSFHLPHGTWAETMLDREGVRALQSRILGRDWASVFA